MWKQTLELAQEVGHEWVVIPWIDAAMRKASYRILDDGTYFGEVPDLRGTWANASNLEACREELREVVEGWILVGLRRGDAIPRLDGITLDVTEVTA